MAIEAYIANLVVFIGIYIIIATSLNLAMGFTGLANLGHVGFYAIGAYASALLALNFDAPFFASIVTAGLLSSFFGLLLAIPTLKLRGDYFALASIGFAVIIESILKNWISVTKGPLGLPGIPTPSIFGFDFAGNYYLFLVGAFAALTYLLISLATKTHFGRLLKAIRDDEIGAAMLGVNALKFKTIALVISAFFAGIAGSLYAHYATFIDPSSFTLLESLLMISMVIVGGVSSINGSVAGAVFLILLPEPLRFLPLPVYGIGALRQIIYASILVFLLIKKPNGILGRG